MLFTWHLRRARVQGHLAFGGARTVRSALAGSANVFDRCLQLGVLLLSALDAVRRGDDGHAHALRKPGECFTGEHVTRAVGPMLRLVALLERGARAGAPSTPQAPEPKGGLGRQEEAGSAGVAGVSAGTCSDLHDGSGERCKGEPGTDGVDAVEVALARAIERASAAGRWDVVAELARELEERRRSQQAPNVVRLELSG